MKTSVKFQEHQARPSVLPRLVIEDGTVEALKWFALVLMTVDHVNKYIFHDAHAWMFYLGRIAMPLFGFVLAYNLARKNTLENGVYMRLIRRLVLAGAISTVPFIALGGLGFGWWPLNIMMMLAVSTGCIYLITQGGALRISLAVLLFVVGGAFVEFWWPAIGMCLAAWSYCKRPNWKALAFWMISLALLFVINRNFWAMAVLPIIFIAPHIRITMPRMKIVFYVYYPVHLAAIWALMRLL